MRYLPFFCLILIILSSCNASIEVTDAEILHQSTYPIYDLEINEDVLYACGGNTFDFGNIKAINLNSLAIDMEFDTEYALFDIDIGSDGQLATCGIYETHFSNDEGVNWSSFNSPELDFFNEVLIRNNTIIAVGGAGLSSGVIAAFDTSLAVQDSTRLLRELKCIYPNNGQILIGGFGALYCQEIDQTLDRKEIQNDNFLDIASDGTTLYMLGETGKMYEKTLSDEEWDRIATPFARATGVSDAEDLAVEEGFVFVSTKEAKIFKRPIDSEAWEVLAFPESYGNILCVEYHDGILYLGTSEGIIARF